MAQVMAVSNAIAMAVAWGWLMTEFGSVSSVVGSQVFGQTFMKACEWAFNNYDINCVCVQTAKSHFAHGLSTQHKIASESQQYILQIPNTSNAFANQY